MSDEQAALKNLEEALRLLESAETNIGGRNRLSAANCRRAQGATMSAIRRLEEEGSDA